MEWYTVHFSRCCRQNGRTIADGSYTFHRQTTPAQDLQRFRKPIEANGYGAIAPGIFEDMAAIGCEYERHAEAPRGIGENANLVSRGCRKKKEHNQLS